MLFGLHPIWAVVVLALVLILFGVGRLPKLGGALGRSIKEFRQSRGNDESKPSNPPADSEKD